MSLLEFSNSTRAGPEKYNIPEAQDRDIKIAFMNMRGTKEEINKPLKEIYERQTRSLQ